MRQIKFKAWNGEYWHPLEDDGDYSFLQTDDGLELWDKHGRCKNTILCQYTGLKDKNGKEIYEGDMLGHPLNVVEWLGDGFCIAGDRPLSMMNQHLEIIGNIHENPELL